MKKIFRILICLILTMCLFSCGKQASEPSLEDPLKENKNSAIQELYDYVEYLGESNYSGDNWLLIETILNEEIETINQQINEEDIINIKNNAITKFDEISPEYMSYRWIVQQFDNTDEKLYWNGSINDEFADDLVIVVLKKTNVYPELDVSAFGLDNAISVEYAGGVRPPEYSEGLTNYRQMVFINLIPMGKQKIVETIKQLETLEFIKSVGPNYISEGT